MTLSLLVLFSPAAAWNSDAADQYGPDAVTVVWTNEHRDIYAAALATRGVDDAESTLTMYTAGGDGVRGTVTDWESVSAQVERPYAPSMFADLPDFSFSLGGWAGGNEVCPLDGGWSSWQCYGKYGFGVGAPPSWLVAGLNSSHFLPQAEAAWAWYHQLAVDDAARCTAMDDALAALAGTDSARRAAVRQCEVEALALEGVAQHYLQDAWSTGHMWQRWGSADIADWGTSGADMARAVLVGTYAGLIHGSEEMPLCQPGTGVEYVEADGDVVLGAGDKHYDRLESLSATQAATLATCVEGSLDEVLSALPGELGGVAGGVGFPGREACFAQRVTNGAMRLAPGFGGAAPSTKVRFVARLLASNLTAEFTGSEAEWASVSARVRRDVVRNMVGLVAASSTAYNPPEATNLAEGTWYDSRGRSWELQVSGMRPNSAYLDRLTTADGLSTFDPTVAAVRGTTAAPTDAQETTAAQLRHGFAAAHVDHWCDQPLATAVEVTRGHCQDTTGESAVREANCGACGMLAQWLRRDGRSAADPGQLDAVCDAYTPGGTRLYVGDWLAPGATEATALSEAWCGHGCATELAVVEVNAADADVTADAELTAYFDRLTGLVMWYTEMGSYYYSIYQWSLGDYYFAEADALGNELIEIGRLLGAARTAEDSYARWSGGWADDDVEATLGTLVAPGEHAVASAAASLDWDADLAELPTQNFAFTLQNGDSYPMVLVADARWVVDADTGARALRLRNLVWVITPYIQQAEATLVLDGADIITVDNLSTTTTEIVLDLSAPGTHRLAVDVTGKVRDTSDLYSPDYDTDLAFRAFAVDFATGPSDSGCGLQ